MKTQDKNYSNTDSDNNSSNGINNYSSNSSVNSSSNINGNNSINGNSSIDGSSSINGSSNIDGSSSINGNSSIDGSSSIKNVNSNSSVNIRNNKNVNSNKSINSNSNGSRNIDDNSNHNVQTMALTAVMTALLCILGPLSVPIGPVPVSLGLFGIFLSSAILGTRKGTFSCLLYLLLGLCGLPVFSGFSGGLSKLMGPTGGYLFGYIFTSVLTGYCFDRFADSVALTALGMLAGLIICYLFGTLWLSFSAHMEFTKALAVGVLPFILLDIAKLLAALFIGKTVRRRLSYLA